MSFWLLTIYSGLIIGIVGNIHCLAMCGPLALSLPTQQFSKLNKFKAILFYNFGRAISYTTIGLVFGLIGSSISVAGLQQGLSIVSGIFLLAFAFFNILKPTSSGISFKFKMQIQQALIKALQKVKNSYSFFYIGLLNGFLPCGLVYIASTTALALGNVYASMLVMFCFGIGTFPLMMALMFLGNQFKNALPYNIKKIVPIFVTLLGCLLILRGLNLNIPFISPSIHIQENSNQIDCH